MYQKQIAARQKYKCANNPDDNLKYINDYDCPLYEYNDGIFDESGYEIDHILELDDGGDNKEVNLQALCKTCHGVKTNNYNAKKGLDKLENSDILTNQTSGNHSKPFLNCYATNAFK